jgi:hypothetical protein
MDVFLSIITNGKVTRDNVEPHSDRLARFPYSARRTWRVARSERRAFERGRSHWFVAVTDDGRRFRRLDREGLTQREAGQPEKVAMMPHKHSEDRVYTVISGVFYIGLADEFDASKLEAYPPGAVIILPGDTPHFHWDKSGEYVALTAMGPLGLEYLSAKDDPRNNSNRRSNAT